MTADTPEGLDPPMDWEIIPGNLAPLLYSSVSRNTDNNTEPLDNDNPNIVALAVYRGDVSHGSPIVSLKVSFGEDCPDGYEVLEMPEGPVGTIYICFAYGSATYSLNDEVEIESSVEDDTERVILDEEHEQVLCISQRTCIHTKNNN